jgi:hypothetical protein
MDTFIFYGDYAKQIQSDNLLQVVGSNTQILESIQAAAVEECKSYLKQKYDVSRAFNPVSQYNPATLYHAGNTVYLNATAYSATATYALNILTLQVGKVYICKTAITVAEAFTIGHWTLLGNQYDIFWAAMSKTEFDSSTLYNPGDEVYWNGKTYVCRQGTLILSHEEVLESGSSNTQQIVNILPDDAAMGQKYWGTGTSYTVPALTLITNVTYWTPGDNRDQKLLMICIDIALYHAHARIAPRNTPELRTHRYIGLPEDRTTVSGRVVYPTYSAIGWLQSCANGDITPEMTIIQPTSGRRIRFGGNAKLNNTY